MLPLRRGKGWGGGGQGCHKNGYITATAPHQRAKILATGGQVYMRHADGNRKPSSSVAACHYNSCALDTCLCQFQSSVLHLASPRLSPRPQAAKNASINATPPPKPSTTPHPVAATAAVAVSSINAVLVRGGFRGVRRGSNRLLVPSRQVFGNTVLGGGNRTHMYDRVWVEERLGVRQKNVYARGRVGAGKNLRQRRAASKKKKEKSEHRRITSKQKLENGRGYAGNARVQRGSCIFVSMEPVRQRVGGKSRAVYYRGRSTNTWYANSPACGNICEEKRWVTAPW